MLFSMVFRFILILFLSGFLPKIFASEFKYWMQYGIKDLVFESGVQGCEYLYSAYFWSLPDYYEPSFNRYLVQGADNLLTYQCGNRYASAPAYVFGDIGFFPHLAKMEVC